MDLEKINPLKWWQDDKTGMNEIERQGMSSVYFEGTLSKSSCSEMEILLECAACAHASSFERASYDSAYAEIHIARIERPHVTYASRD